MAGRARPRCRYPVGLGAKRTRTGGIGTSGAAPMLGGEGGIRTLGPVLPGQRFSKASRSATPAPLLDGPRGKKRHDGDATAPRQAQAPRFSDLQELADRGAQAPTMLEAAGAVARFRVPVGGGQRVAFLLRALPAMQAEERQVHEGPAGLRRLPEVLELVQLRGMHVRQPRVAEGAGFEPAGPLRARTLSRRLQSTALPPLRAAVSLMAWGESTGAPRARA